MAGDERTDAERPELNEEPDAAEPDEVESGGYRGPDPEDDPKGDYSDEDQGT